MNRLVKDVGHKIILILDNLRVHRFKPVKEWLALNTDKIEVFYFPTYSTELNPDKYMNRDLNNCSTCQQGRSIADKKTDSEKHHFSFEASYKRCQEKLRHFSIARTSGIQKNSTFNCRSNKCKL